MAEITAVDGPLLAPDSIRIVECLKARASELSATEICNSVRAAAAGLFSDIAMAAVHARSGTSQLKHS
jgi:hypothetical protein